MKKISGTFPNPFGASARSFEVHDLDMDKIISVDVAVNYLGHTFILQ